MKSVLVSWVAPSKRFRTGSGALILAATLLLGTAQADALSLSLATNRDTFVAGDVHTLSIGVENPDAPVTADAYLALLLPGGAALFGTLEPGAGTLSFTSGNPADPATWTPFVEAVPLPAGLDIGGVPIFSYTFSGLEPHGDYHWVFLLTAPGNTDAAIDVATRPFVVRGIADLLVGTWVGTWTDTVFNVSGPFSLEVTRDGSIIRATGSIGLNEIGPFVPAEAGGTATGEIRAGGGGVDFTFDASLLGGGSGTIDGRDVTGTGAIVNAIGFGEFTFSGRVEDGTLTGQFDFPFGGAGIGTATRQ